MPPTLLPFLAAATLLVVLPGPDTLVVLRAVLLRGRRTAAWTCAGVVTGLSAWLAAAVLGLSVLVRASHLGYLALRLAGGAYLVWLGVQALRARSLPTRDEEARLAGVGYRAGLLTNLLNPKVGLFFVSFLPGFVPAGAAVPGTIALLGAVFALEGAAYLALVVALGDRLARLLRRDRVRSWLDRATGLVLVGFGVRLLVERG